MSKAGRYILTAAGLILATVAFEQILTAYIHLIIAICEVLGTC